jgi:nitric oxide reductase NorD protein
MSEPEELILEGAHFATRVARDTWRRYAPPRAPTALRLSDVRARLEVFIAGLFGAPIAVSVLQPPAPVTWLGRLASRSQPRKALPLCATDGVRVFLAEQLDGFGTPEQTLRMYRLLAVQQAARIARQTARILPQRATPQARDLFMLAEAAAVDRWIAVHAPGLIADVNTARGVAAAQRGNRKRQPHETERAVRALLTTDAKERTIAIPD